MMLGRLAVLAFVVACLAATPVKNHRQPLQPLVPRDARAPAGSQAQPLVGPRAGAASEGGATPAGTVPAPDSLPGLRTECTDFRSGLGLPIQAQRLLGDGSVARDWTPDLARLCLGSAEGVASASVPDGAGGAIVVWVDNRTEEGDLYAQRFDQGGAVASGWPRDGVPVCVARGSQYQPATVGDSAGGAIVVWTDYRSGRGDIYAQHLAGDGHPAWIPDGVPVCADSADQLTPVAVPDGAGGVLVIWQDRREGAARLYCRHVAADGTLTADSTGRGAPLSIGTGLQLNPVACADGGGGAVVVWEERTGGASGIRALRVSAQGVAVAGWPAGGVALTTAAGKQRWPTLIPDGSGGALVAWSDAAADRGNIVAQHVTGGGTVAWAPDGLALCTAIGEQTFPAIASDGSGGAILAWEDFRGGNHSDVYAQRVGADGNPAWAAKGVPLCLAAGDQYGVTLASDGSEGVVATWTDARSASRGQFFTARLLASGPAPVLESKEVGPTRVQLAWRTAPKDQRTFRLLRRSGPKAWKEVATRSPQADGLLAIEDRDVLPGDNVHYRLAIVAGDETLLLSEITVEIPLPKPLALRFARSEDGGRTVRVALTLATDDGAKLELFDVSGRRVLAQEVGSLGAGDHEVRLSLPRMVRTGIYFLRLGQGRATRTGRVTVLR